MKGFVRYSLTVALALLMTAPAVASEADGKSSASTMNLREFDLGMDLGIDLSATDIIVAANGAPSTYHTVTPNIPDSAFEKPWITENNLHMYLGLASLAMGGLAAISAPSDQTDLLNTVHYKAAKASWQLGAAAVASGFYSHWDDFHVEDGILDRDNLHVLLGLLGTLGYYLAVQGAVSDYNSQRLVTKDHVSKGIFGGAAMTVAIGLTW